MQPQSQPRKKRNSSKVNFVISFAFHALLALVVLYFAARQGWLGKPLETLSVNLVKKKPPEKPPEKPKEPPKVEPPKIQPPKIVDVPKIQTPATVAPPTVAPPAVDLPSFDVPGGKEVVSSSDPVQLYKGYMEYMLRQKWNRPENMADDNYAVEVAVSVDKSGRIGNPVWQKSSGNEKWDDSVKEIFNNVTSIDHAPPTNFPPNVTIRFDVQQETEPLLQ